jgi:hypothetical protein
MAGVVPRYDDGPVTFQCSDSASIVGGMLVESDAGSPAKVQPASAGSQVSIGVATNDTVGVSVSQVPTVPGTTSPSINAALLPPYVAVASDGVYPVRYAATTAFGARLKCAANGQVTPWVSGTDNAELIVGICYEPGGVTVSSGFVVGAMQLSGLS